MQRTRPTTTRSLRRATAVSAVRALGRDVAHCGGRHSGLDTADTAVAHHTYQSRVPSMMATLAGGPARSRNRMGATTLRWGFSITELLFAISAISALSILAMTVVGLLITAEQRGAESLWVDVTIANLAADLRDDAHRATDINATADDAGRVSQITLIQPNEMKVTYECLADSVVRREQQGGERQRTETYRLALGTSRFEFPTESGLLIWTHTREIPSIGGFSQPTPVETAPTRTYQVMAALSLRDVSTSEESE